MEFVTKAVVVVREDLMMWQKLNVTAFLTSGLIGAEPDLIGERYRDASGQSYRALLVQPVIVLVADAAGLAKILHRALSRGADPAIYTQEMFATGHDLANRAAVQEFETDALNLVGVALREERKLVDKITKGARMHP